MSIIDKSRLLLFVGGTVPGAGASAGDLAAEIAAREALAGEVAGKAGIDDSGKIFADRASAVAAGQSVLVPALGRIVTIEGDYVVFRGPYWNAPDPLFDTSPWWAVAARVPRDALLQAVAEQLENVPAATLKGRLGPDAGAAEDLTPLAVRTMLHLLALEDRGDDGPPWSVGDGKRSWLYLDDAGDLRGPWADALTGMLMRRSEGGPLWSVGGKPGRWGNATSPLCLLDDDENTIRNRYLDRIAASALRVTPRPKLYIAGDSRGDQSSNPGRTPANGWLAHLQMLTAGRFDFDPADNIAVAGSNSEQMLAAVGPLLTAAPGVVVAIISTNDRTQGWSAQRSIDALSIWQAQVLARGHQVIWIAEMPRGETGNTAYALSGANLQAHMRVRQWLLAQASVPGVYVADPWPAMCDPASASGYVKAGLMYDGLHTGVPGARAVAECIAPIINALMPPHPRLIISAADTYTANNPTGALNGNPMMSGTGGTLDGGASGALASGWSIQTGAGMAAVLSKVELDGLPAQRCVVSGAPTGASAGASPVDPTPHAVVISADIANPANLVPGDVVELTGLVSLAAGSEGCRAVALYLTIETASGTVTHCAMEPLLARSVPNLDQPDSVLSGPAIVPRFTVTEAVTAASVSLMIVGAPHISSQPDIAISATVDFTALSLKKVI
ncbi:SGNH/GDSL hydrolase family protein [Paracoccus denitrificans]|uniref:SGNH/GDSL hydrolase family protein n=1 Tax=Paracoccus denitrificans TaxID=266 RepID=UPI000CEBCBE8|nr:SGNH/GDSL hydrolase family protein [Paracoccus denitrificans]